MSFLSKDVGIDLGTANTLVYMKGKGIIMREPSVVAVDTKTDEVRCVGGEAKAVIGRTPGSIVAVRPLKDGVIADFDITANMLENFLKKACGNSMFSRPRVVICIPSGVTEVERRAVREATLKAGARQVSVIEEPMAAAIGAGLPISEPTGSMIVDIGGGTAEIAVISLGGIVASRSVRMAGDMFGQAIIENAPILFAVATIENAYDQTAELVTVDAPDVYEQEPILLQRAFANMPRILVDSCELLIVDECGKYFSGNGMDPNVSGKFPTPYASGGIESQHIVALDIDEASHGNAQGLGLASATTVRAVKKLDLDAMYVNGITCKMLYGCEIPPFMNNDREAIQMGLAMCVDYDEAHPRIVRIPNTLHLEHIMLSEAYYDEARRNPDLIIESEPAPLAFDADGNLAFDLDNAP